MKVKNVNPFEKHVEKIVLALAVLGAGYLGYSAFSDPVKVERPDGGDALTAEEVEPAIGAAVSALTKQMDKNMTLPLDAQVANFVVKYRDIDKTPLQEGLLAAVPLIEPVQAPPSGFTPPPSRGGSGLVENNIPTPVIPAPLALTADVSRGTVLVTTVAGEEPKPQDLAWITLKADYPMKALNAAIHNIKRLPLENQRVTFYRVAVNRATQKPDGSWGDWDSIAPAKSVELPTDELSVLKGHSEPTVQTTIATALTKLDEAYLSILRPSFYTLAPSVGAAAAAVATGVPAPVAPVTPPVVAPIGPAPTGPNQAQLRDRETRPTVARPTTPAAPGPVIGPATGGPVPGGLGAAGMGGPPGGAGGGGLLPGEGPAGALPIPTGKDAVLTEEKFPIWFYDEHIEPGHTYKYRMSVRVYNPLFRLDMQLMDQAKRNEPYLDSGWVYLATPIHVEANRHFYIVRGFGGGADRSASVMFYQWEKGHWFTAEQTVAPGKGIGKVETKDGQKVDFTTGFTVVNVENSPTTTRVTMMDPSGLLVVRDSQVDVSDPIRRKLDKEILDASKAAAAGTAMLPAGAGN